jgi:hypothetical protein
VAHTITVEETRMGKDSVAPRRRMTKRQLTRVQRQWRTAIRETIKVLPLPEGTALPDMLALFDAISAAVQMGRRIVEAVERLAENPNPPKAVA